MVDLIIKSDCAGPVTIPGQATGGSHWFVDNQCEKECVSILFREQYIWVLAPGEHIKIWMEHLRHYSTDEWNQRWVWNTKTLIGLESKDLDKQIVLWSSIVGPHTAV